MEKNLSGKRKRERSECVIGLYFTMKWSGKDMGGKKRKK